jgi:hypothetical protein
MRQAYSSIEQHRKTGSTAHLEVEILSRGGSRNLGPPLKSEFRR